MIEIIVIGGILAVVGYFVWQEMQKEKKLGINNGMEEEMIPEAENVEPWVIEAPKLSKEQEMTMYKQCLESMCFAQCRGELKSSTNCYNCSKTRCTHLKSFPLQTDAFLFVPEPYFTPEPFISRTSLARVAIG